MSRTANRTKAHILSAAVSLFSVQGFGGTSIREIADAAQVNSALVSYHFKNKQGILESIMVDYFETLFQSLSQRKSQSGEKDCFAGLISAVDLILDYQSQHTQVSTIIQRELSVDSMLVREVMSTYIARLKGDLSHYIEQGMESGQFRDDIDMDMQIIHMMSSMFFPYFNPQIVREVFYVEPTSEQYRRKYVHYLSVTWYHQLKKL